MKTLPDGWRWERLGDVSEVNLRRSVLSRESDEPTTLVAMEAGDERFEEVIRYKVVRFGEVQKGLKTNSGFSLKSVCRSHHFARPGT